MTLSIHNLEILSPPPPVLHLSQRPSPVPTGESALAAYLRAAGAAILGDARVMFHIRRLHISNLIRLMSIGTAPEDGAWERLVKKRRKLIRSRNYWQEQPPTPYAYAIRRGIATRLQITTALGEIWKFILNDNRQPKMLEEAMARIAAAVHGLYLMCRNAFFMLKKDMKTHRAAFAARLPKAAAGRKFH